MRTIKFRGKTQDNRWLYGSYACFKDFDLDSHCILNGDMWEDVNPNTVGQFTGLYDVDGNEIYEDDILTSTFGYKSQITVMFGEYSDNEVQPTTSVGFYFRDHWETFGFGKSTEGNTNCYKVIGNIHDNPELL